MKSQLFYLKKGVFLELSYNSIKILDSSCFLGHKQATVCSTWIQVITALDSHGLYFSDITHVFHYFGKKIPKSLVGVKSIYKPRAHFRDHFPDIFGLPGFRYCKIPGKKVVIISD